MIRNIREWLDRHFSDPQLVVLGSMLIFGFFMIYFLGELLTPFFAAIVISYLLDGMVARLQKWRVPRLAAILIAFLVFLACLLAVLLFLIPLLYKQFIQLLESLPHMVSEGKRQLMALPQRYPDFISEQQIAEIIDYVSTQISQLGGRMLSWSLASVRGIITFIVYLILVPFMVFFLLKDKVKILKWFKGFLPEQRHLGNAVWYEVNAQIANYIRGKIWEILIVWWGTYITFALLQVPYALLLSLFVGLSVLIPYIGATVMYLPVMLLAYLEYGLGMKFIYIVGAYSILQMLDGYVLVPILFSGVVHLHPVAIIVGVLVFGGLWGVWGLFFAVPLVTLVQAVVRVMLDRFRINKAERENASHTSG